jgi:hypothetical protein
METFPNQCIFIFLLIYGHTIYPQKYKRQYWIVLYKTALLDITNSRKPYLWTCKFRIYCYVSNIARKCLQNKLSVKCSISRTQLRVCLMKRFWKRARKTETWKIGFNGMSWYNVYLFVAKSHCVLTRNIYTDNSSFAYKVTRFHQTNVLTKIKKKYLFRSRKA